MKIGTIVWLKSGGPAMTVSEISSSDIFCVWFVEGKKTGDEFPEESLTTEKPN
jgi:uncharacterized protein YodC (DUF2158 family)